MESPNWKIQSLKMLKKSYISELRQDIVSGDWVVVAEARSRRPHEFRKLKKSVFETPKSRCQFEDPQKSGNLDPLLAYDRNSHHLKVKGQDKDYSSWFIQVIGNKYPAFGRGICKTILRHGPYTWQEGVGYHEVVITRPHDRGLSRFETEEVEIVLKTYRQRFLDLRSDACVDYISVFHNAGKEAGASISHPHSQLIAIPVIPPDVFRSLRGSQDFFERNKKCVHCFMIAWEKKARERILFENDEFIVFIPFAPRVSCETRIFPKKHSPHFWMIDDESLPFAAEALRQALARLNKGLGNPDYNFFIHTAPVKGNTFEHYHWHIEILPKTAIWAGFELGTGIEVSVVKPEEAAKFLRSIKV